MIMQKQVEFMSAHKRWLLSRDTKMTHTKQVKQTEVSKQETLKMIMSSS